MVKFYVLQIQMGKINIDDVPLRWREKVKKEIEKNEGKVRGTLLSVYGI